MTETPALSASIANVLITESPLHAWSCHRLLGGVPRVETDSMRKGKLYHQLLVPGGARLAVLDFKDWRTKLAKEARDEAIAKKQTPILKGKYDEAREGAERIRTRLLEEHGIDLAAGDTEVRVEWNEPSLAGADVLCHGYLDWLSREKRRILDLKTGDGSVSLDACTRSLIHNGGAIQYAAYISAAHRLWPELAGRVEMQFIFAETKEPYAVTVIEPAGSMAELGESRWRRAVDAWERCLANDRWPGPSDGIARVAAPSWAITQEMALEDADVE